MGGLRSSMMVVLAVVVAVASGSWHPSEARSGDDEPPGEQRATRADVPDPPPDRPLPEPPASLDLRRPSLGPGGLNLPRDAADPDILVVGAGTYYLFSTNSAATNVPVWKSTDLMTWDHQGDAMPDLPSWAATGGGTTWAPSVHRVGSAYNLYFSSMHVGRGRFCIGVATSADPAGPYRPRPDPLVCQTRRGGAIDPFLFIAESGARFLIFKTDGNCCGLRTKLWSQRLTGNGLSLAGRASELMSAGAEWEEGVIEGPTMVERSGRFHLFYSGNWWNTHHYAIGHAVCEGVNGRCYRSSPTPFMTNRSDGVGFGGPSVWSSPSGETWMSYHGWFGAGVGYENGGVRAAFAHRLDFPDWSPPPTCYGLAATISGTSADDVIMGTRRSDVIVAGGGNDNINGVGGDDVICAGGGDDTVHGGKGHDRIRGEAGQDLVMADGGRDLVDGGPGGDELRGDLGQDRVWGGGGDDECWGERMRCETKHRTNHDGGLRDF